MEIREKVLLSSLTTFQIGGPADFFTVVKSVEELKEALVFSNHNQLPVFVIGNGSNLLISDSGFKGLVIHNQIKGLTVQKTGEISVGAGENWDDIAAVAAEKELAGIECLSGIPGSAGGAVVQNIGAYGQVLSDVVIKVYAVEASSLKDVVFSPKDCQFEYRASLFKENVNNYIVTGFELKLNSNGKPTITYAHVKKHFENKPMPTLLELRRFILQIRASKGYLIMPGFENFKTAGSFFKNPIVTAEQFESLKPILGDESSNRYWPMPQGVKIAAAFLMQEAGFEKGYRIGNVGISPKHSLSIVNFGNGKASEIKQLADQIKQAVSKKFNVQLDEEVLYIGDFN